MKQRLRISRQPFGCKQTNRWLCWGMARLLLDSQPKRAQECCEIALDRVVDANAYLPCGEADYPMAFVGRNTGKNATPLP